jgi:hypothetical protein
MYSRPPNAFSEYKKVLAIDFQDPVRAVDEALLRDEHFVATGSVDQPPYVTCAQITIILGRPDRALR